MEEKTLGYDWEYGHEELIIKVDAYTYGNRLYVGLFKKEDGMLESFGDLTVNLPHEPACIGEAYIEDFSGAAKLKFIKKHKLGKVLPECGHSGYVTYRKVAFNLERLAELDPEGMERFREINGLKKDEKPKKKRKTEPER